jgi:tetratricopeptide (TPR) repeat protein
MSKIQQFRKSVAEKYHAFELEEAARLGEALLREHWNNHSMMTLGYANDIYNLARVYDELGDFDKAVALYTDGAQLFSRQCTGDATAYSDCLNNLAAVLYDMGMTEPSVQLFGQLLAVKQSFGQNDDVKYADNLYNLANALPDTLNQTAREMHRQAFNLRMDADAAQDMVDSLHCLAFLHEEKEEYDRAVPYAKRAMGMAEGDDYTCSVNYLAALYDAWGKYDMALPLYEEVLDLTRERVGRTHSSYLEAAINRVRMLEKLERPREALAVQKELRVLIEGFHPDDRQGVYTECLRSTAELHKQLEEYEQAERLFLQSLKLSRKKNEDLTVDVSHLVRLYLHMGDNKKALEILVYALMHSDAKGSGLAELLTKLAIAFNPSIDPAPDVILTALRTMNDREILQPIIDKWTAWENEFFIPAFVMPSPIGQGKR